MDWFAWLLRTGLDRNLVYEYGLSFMHNELEREDICHFTHEFLQSMGISIAKHRLEILKLARKDNKEFAVNPRPISRLLSAIKNTRNCLTKYVRAMSICEDSALAIVPRPRSYSSRRLRGAVLRKSQRLGMVHNSKQGRLLLTNGSKTPMVVSTPRLQSFSSPLVYAISEDDKIGAHSERYWSPGGMEEMRWDSMFQDLKPT